MIPIERERKIKHRRGERERERERRREREREREEARQRKEASLIVNDYNTLGSNKQVKEENKRERKLQKNMTGKLK